MQFQQGKTMDVSGIRVIERPAELHIFEDANNVVGAEATRSASTIFDAEDRDRGREARKCAAITVTSAVFGVGRLCSLSRRKFASRGQARGRRSLYGHWLDEYLPHIDRKTLGRWRAAYDTLKPLISEENGTECLDLFDRIDLTAIYALCRSSVTNDQRSVVLELARAGRAISKVSLADILGPLAPPAPPLQRKHIPLPAGKVTIVINHPDFRQALQEALWELDRE